jgi:hypothetical protein
LSRDGLRSVAGLAASDSLEWRLASFLAPFAQRLPMLEPPTLEFEASRCAAMLCVKATGQSKDSVLPKEA